MLGKLYTNHKKPLLVYLICISLILTLKIDKMGLLVLTLLFLSMNVNKSFSVNKYFTVNKYYTVIGSCLFYLFYYRYTYEGFVTGVIETETGGIETAEITETTEAKVTLDPSTFSRYSLPDENAVDLDAQTRPNEIYYKFMKIIEDLDTTEIDSNALDTDILEINTEYWARLFSDSNLIESKYFIKGDLIQDPLLIDRMVGSTIEKIFTIMDSVENSENNIGSNYKTIKDNLDNTYLGEKISFLYYKSLSEPEKRFNQFDERNQPNILVNEFVKDAEFKTIDTLNNEAKKDFIEKNKNIKNVELVTNLTSQFSETMIKIIEELLELLNNKVTFTSVYDSYLYYIKNIFLIFTEDGRLFYIGIFFMVISMCLFFIETTK